MKFERKSKSSGVKPLSSCSGCSNHGNSAYQGSYYSQAASSAGRCTEK